MQVVSSVVSTLATFSWYNILVAFMFSSFTFMGSVYAELNFQNLTPYIFLQMKNPHFH